MISVATQLQPGWENSIDRWTKTIHESVAFAGVAAMALVIYDEAVANTSGDRKTGLPGGPPGVVTGNLHKAIYRVFSKTRSNDQLKTYQISWNKTKAPHGFLVEYGTSHTPAHPFMRPAWSHIEQAIESGRARMSEQIALLGSVP